MKTAAPLGKAVNWESTFGTSLTLQTRAPKCAHDKKRYRLPFWESRHKAERVAALKVFSNYAPT
jgi:hypothetical protein